MIADSLKNLNKHLFALFIIAISVALDQLSKYWAYSIVGDPTDIVKVTEFLNLVIVANRGISFGMFQNFEYSNLFFIVTTVAITLFLLKLLNMERQRLNIFFLCLIISGAIGNLIDRIKYSAVRDFIDFHLGDYHWPVFNLADSMISIGVLIYILLPKKYLEC